MPRSTSTSPSRTASRLRPSFPDTGLLVRSTSPHLPTYAHAAAVIDDPRRRWVWTTFLWLECVPMPTFAHQTAQVAVLEGFFARARNVDRKPVELMAAAKGYASRYGLTAVDALHIAAAVRAACVEFVTTENDAKRDAKGVGSRLYRVTEVKVVHVDDVVV